MFRFTVQSFALVAALIGSVADARLAEENKESRQLDASYGLGVTQSCAQLMDIQDRCCGADQSACDCPVRPYTGFGESIIDYFWDLKCQNIADTMPDCVDDIPTIAIAAGAFETLVAALTAADLVGAISAPAGPFTVFAPTDDAFAALPEGLVSCLLGDLPTLSNILLYHVVEGKAMAADLTDGQEIPTLLGPNITVDLSEPPLVKINDSTVTTADIPARNGVIHIIDAVLVPPGVDVEAYLEACQAPSEPEPTLPSLDDIATIAVGLPDTFSTLVTALSAAGLVDAVSAPADGLEIPQLTVFAPTNDAFAALPEGLLTCLLKEDGSNIPVLTSILAYHVAPVKALSTDLTDGMEIPTLLTVDDVNQVLVADLSMEGVVKINTATVIDANIEALNGVIHVIDAVLVPPGVNATAFLESEACTA